MKIQCDACEGAAATVVCCADEAALCARCDVEIHAANKLATSPASTSASRSRRSPPASRAATSARYVHHQRMRMRHTHKAGRHELTTRTTTPPRARSQEKAAFIFCVEDRALFCRDCDEPIHVPGTLSGNHQRYLATGIRVGFASASSACSDACDAHDDSDHHARPKAAVSSAAQQVPSPPQFLPQGWAVDELLQFSDCESSDKARRQRKLRSMTNNLPACTHRLMHGLVCVCVFCSCTRSPRSGSRSWSGSPTSTSSTSRRRKPAGDWPRYRSFPEPRPRTTRRTTGQPKPLPLPAPGCARARRPGPRSPTTRTTSSSLISAKIKERAGVLFLLLLCVQPVSCVVHL
jgi:hypothetical protein